jgi:pimeloyl-ACP methyl ester carboxylesterase
VIRVIDTGTGSPMLIIPGIQGRWEWMIPAVDALSRVHRVITFSLDEEPEPGDFWDAFITRLLDRVMARPVTLVGVSFGGLVAARYAARHPERVGALVLVSAPSPGRPLDDRSLSYIRRPFLSVPAFAIRGLSRLLPEVIAARPDWWSRLRCFVGHAGRVVRFPLSPRHMAAWVHAWQALDIAADCRRIVAPTLVMTGEADLDQVVPLASTLDYLALIPGARYVKLANTGHIGLVTRPEAFAALVGEFSKDARHTLQAPAATCT